MNPHQPNTPPAGSSSLDLYLDGLLSPHDQAAFEARLAKDAALQREVELARQLEDSIARVFPAPAHLGVAPASLPGPGTPGSGRRTSPLSKAIAIAASIALLAFAGYNLFGPVPSAPSTRTTPAELYHRLVSAGYKPEFVCDTDEEFASEVKKRLGQPLLFAPKTGIELVGWAYSGGYSGGITLSPSTLILMTRVEGKEVIVLMDRALADRQMAQPKDPSLKMFRGRVGNLVLYEISPCEEPVLLNQAYDPVVQPEGPPPVDDHECKDRKGPKDGPDAARDSVPPATP